MKGYFRLYEGRESFADKEEEKAYREKQRALTRLEVEEIWDLVCLPPGSRILDLYCGNGRHAVALAQKGVESVGVDTSFTRVSFAHHWARDEGIRAAFLVGDAEDLPLGRFFDAVLILGGSFTHCVEEERNISLLLGFKEVLRPLGLLLIDNPNPLRFWRIQHPGASRAEENEVAYFDFPLGQGEISVYVRYYGMEMMKKLFQKAGLEVRGILGERAGRPYSFDSPRLIVIGQATP